MRLLSGGHVEMLGWRAVGWMEGLQECGAACRAAGRRGWMLGCEAVGLKVGGSVGMRSCRAGRRCWAARRVAAAAAAPCCRCRSGARPLPGRRPGRCGCLCRRRGGEVLAWPPREHLPRAGNKGACIFHVRCPVVPSGY